MDIDATQSRKIPTGMKPERYPRTGSHKKYRESKLWDKMGPKKTSTKTTDENQSEKELRKTE